MVDPSDWMLWQNASNLFSQLPEDATLAYIVLDRVRAFVDMRAGKSQCCSGSKDSPRRNDSSNGRFLGSAS